MWKSPYSIGFFLLVIVIIFVSFVVRKVTKPQAQVTPEEKEVEPPESAPRVLFVDGHPSAAPSPSDPNTAKFVKTSIATYFHPFIIKEDGSAVMLNSLWWRMNDTRHVCIGFERDSFVFLTNHGLYYCSARGTIKISEEHTIEKVPVLFSSVHNYANTLYALDQNGKLHRLVSQREWTHSYEPYLQEGVLHDFSSLASQWFWGGMDSFCGLPVSSQVCERVEVVHEHKRESVYLQLKNKLMKYSKGRWRVQQALVRCGVAVKLDRGKVLAISREGVIRQSKGHMGAICGRHSVLYSVEGSELYRVANDTKNIPTRVSTGWTDLLLVEDGTLIGVSSGMVLPL